MFLANIRRKTIDIKEDDLCLADFIRSGLNCWREEDLDYIIYTYADAFQQGIYGGTMETLSARSCQPFANAWAKYVLKEPAEEFGTCEHESAEHAFRSMMKNKSSACNFKLGM
jgi:hypothetical protein